MARQVLPIVGYAIGSYFGGPWGAAIGQAIGTVVGNAVDPLVIDGPKIGEVAQQTSSEGVYQPIYFGTAQGAGNIIAQGPNVIRRRRESQGKGGGPVTVIETLYKTFAIRIGVSWRGEEGIIGISRIWENGKLVFDVRPESTIVAESAQFAANFTLYTGTDTQAPDPALEAIYGVGNTPSYRGRAYIVFPLYDITQWRAIPQYSFEVVTGGTADPPVQMIALANQGWIPSPDGEDWSASAIVDTALPGNTWYLLSTNETFIAYAQTGSHPAYIEPGQTVWTQCAGDSVASVGGIKWGAFNIDESIGLIPDGLNGNCLQSLDKGRTWTRLPGTLNPGISAIACYNFKFYAIRNSTIYESLDGASWSLDFVTGLNIGAGLSRASGGFMCAFGGRAGALPMPGVMLNENGLDWVAQQLPGMTSSLYLSAMCIGKIGADSYETLVMAGNNGDIAVYRPGAGIQYSSDVFPSTPSDIAWNGDVFVMIGGSLGETGYIWTSPDGINWNEAKSGAIASSPDAWRAVGALSLSGGEVVSEPPYLDEVVSTIHTLCLQPASEYDVTALSDIIVRGYILAGGYSGKEAINTLQNLWMIDSPEYDKKIVYRKRGANVVASLTFDDLIDEPEEATREQAIEYPKKLHLDYQSPDVDYAPAKATSSRSSIDARVIGEIGIQVPVVLNPTEAFQRANVLHKVSWADADGEVIIYVPDEYLYLVPGDCVAIYLRGTVRRLRIDGMEYYPGRIKLTCRGDRQSAYTSNVEGLEPPPPTPPPPSLVGPTAIIVGDWPALRDQDDVATPVKYVAMGGITEAWQGALGEQSVDAGTSYNSMVSVYQGAIMGTLQDDISDAAPYFADHTNVVTVQLDITDGSIELNSLTELQFLMEMGGFALVKEDGTFEIMQYRDANDLGDGLYELSYLQRGRLDSETHSFDAGDRFVLLESVVVVPGPVSQIGVDMYYRATSFGQTTEDGTVVHEVYTGQSQREWPVAHILMERVGDTINGTIIPRHRFGTEVNPVRSINWTGYEITFQDSLDQFETIAQTSDTFTYDGSAMTFPITVTVYQTNRLTGSGPGKSEVVE